VKTATKKSIIMMICLKAKSGSRDTSEIELILAKPIRVSKIFCLSDVPDSSQNQHDESHCLVQMIGERAPHVITFDNLNDDSSPDVHGTSPLGKVADVPLLPPPFIPCELSCRAFANLF
jgi:hypothetical protein